MKEKEKNNQQQPEEAPQPNEQLEKLQKEKDDLFAQLQRVSADYANFQKRTPRQIEERVAYEKEHIVKALLPILDNFEHAIDKSHTAENAQAVIDGVKIVYDQMLAILKQLGVEQINALGQQFDPAMHQAIMQKTDPDQEDNIVLDDFAKGYKLQGRVIRPSRVAVNKAAQTPPDIDDQPEVNPDVPPEDTEL